MIKWVLYVMSLGFAVYWASNLFLWFPWSHSAVLGMILMLTVAPILWGYVTLLCLKTYPGQDLIRGALRIAAILVSMAVIMDYIFFGLIRNAMQQLYHPTTFYAYGFLVSLPFMIGVLFKNKIKRNKRLLTNTDFVTAGISGLLCFGILVLIIVLGIEI